MLDLSHIPSNYPNADVQVFVGSSSLNTVANDYVWMKPRGKTMGHILIVGNGGGGGNGIVGANSFAGGGGGGGSGSQTSIRFPLWAVPDRLYVRVWGTFSTNGSVVAIEAGIPVVNNILVVANAAGAGGNGTTVPAGGAAGTAAGVAVVSAMPLGWQWLQQALGGQAGSAGGVSGNGVGIGLPVTGLVVIGGASGGGLPATAAAGTNGGSINGAGVFPGMSSQGPAAATVPPGTAASGYSPIANLLYNYGGAGGGSSHGSATGAGLFGGNGGNGAPGCGGGGGGACLTGGVAGVGGKGGPAFCIITCW